MEILNTIRRLFNSRINACRCENDGGVEGSNELDPDLLERKLGEGWRQGSILSVASSKLLDDFVSEKVLVVITQTCDLLHRSIDKEPAVELLTGEIREGAAPKHAGKSFREFELELECSDSKRHVHILSRPRVEVCRRIFFEHAEMHEHQPTSNILEWFSRWLGEKYSRPAFPNSFDHKLAKYKNKIAKAIKAISCCRGMYLALSSWGEVDEYTVTIVLLLKHNSSQEETDEAEKAFTKICGYMESSGHIVNEEESGVQLDSEMTIRDFSVVKKWSLDYISIANSEHEKPPSQ